MLIQFERLLIGCSMLPIDIAYSVRNDFTGFAIAALIVWAITNTDVMNPNKNIVTINGVAVISIL